MKESLLTDPCLAIADPELPFEVVTDACSCFAKGIAGVLLQEGRPVAFAGGALTSAEQRYHTTDQELLAVVFAIDQWRCYLQGAKHHFLLVTDHHPNTYLKTQPNLNRRQARWSEKLQEYDFSWSYRKGAQNVADAVSRAEHLPPLLQSMATQMRFDWVQRPDELEGGLAEAIADHSDVFFPLISAATLVAQPAIILAATTRSRVRAQASQPEQAEAQPEPEPAPRSAFVPASFGEPDAVQLSWLPELRAAYLQDPQLGDPTDLSIQHKHVTKRNGLWFKGSQIVVPACPAIKRKILAELHDSKYAGHGGEAKTIDLVRRYFWWPHLDLDCKQFVKGCALCQRNKASTQKVPGLLHQHDVPTQRW